MEYASLTPKDQAAFYSRLAEKNPMKRVATAEDVAQAIIYLCSPGAAKITGIILPVDGGHSLTSTLHSDWEGTEHMNARFAPTGPGTIPKFLRWFENEVIERINPTTRDIQWYRNHRGNVQWDIEREDGPNVNQILH
jgi:hypothetical protein